VAEQQSAHLASLVGTRQHVLVEGPSRGDTGRFSGRSERHEITHFDAPQGHDPTGHLVEVEITEAYKHSLLGRAVGEVPRGPLATKVPRGRLALPVVA
jgi:tRNA-2-methylthio-N6-dimethylallyladenosine synthase